MHIGREKPINPSLTWSSDEPSDHHLYRQVSLSTSDDLKFCAAVLGSDNTGVDRVTVHEIAGDLTSVARNVKLPLRNGRLATSTFSVVWQCPGGKIYDRKII